jgi:hypothetical protein
LLTPFTDGVRRRVRGRRLLLPAVALLTALILAPIAGATILHRFYSSYPPGSATMQEGGTDALFAYLEKSLQTYGPAASAGQDSWVSIGFYFPSKTYVTSHGWHDLWGMKGYSGDDFNGVAAWNLDGSDNEYTLNQNTGAPSVHWDTSCNCYLSGAPAGSGPTYNAAYDLGAIALDRWTQFVLHFHWAHDSTGQLQVWRDGTLIVSKNVVTLNSDSDYMRWPHETTYRPGSPTNTQSLTFYQTPMQMGSSLANALSSPPAIPDLSQQVNDGASNITAVDAGSVGIPSPPTPSISGPSSASSSTSTSTTATGTTTTTATTTTSSPGSSSSTSTGSTPTSALGTTSVGSAKEFGGAGYLDVDGPFSLSAPATASSLVAYLGGGSSTGTIRPVVYAVDSSGNPTSLVATGPEKTIAAGQSPGWVTLPLAGTVTLPAGRYAIGFWYGGNVAIYEASQSGVEHYAPDPYSSTGSPNGSFGSASTSASLYSVYLPYTPLPLSSSTSSSGVSFGSTSAGGSFDRGGSGYLDVSGPYTSSGGSVSKLTAYVAGESSNLAVRGVIYSDAGGRPGSLVGVTPEVTVPAGSSAGWVDLAFSSPVTVGAGSYWIGYWYGPGAGSGAGGFAYSTASGAEQFAPAAYSATGSPPSSFPAGSSSASRYSLYAH